MLFAGFPRVAWARRVLALCGASMFLSMSMMVAGCSSSSEVDPSIKVVGSPAESTEEPPRPKFKKGVPQAPTGLQRRRNPGAE